MSENRGLNPYSEDVTRRTTLENYITLAADALQPLCDFTGNDDGRAMQKKRDHNKMLQDFITSYHYLKNHKDCNGKVVVVIVSFCFGG